MNVLPYLASFLMLAAADGTPQQNAPHGQFQIAHVPNDESQYQALTKCEYGDGSKCLFMNRERMSRPIQLKFRFDSINVSSAGIVDEAEYIAWIQRNNNACHWADNDTNATLLGRAPVVTTRNVGASRNTLGVIFDKHRLEMSSQLIMGLTGGKPVGFEQWQICIGMDPKHGTVIESDKHPVGSLPFNIGTRTPDAPYLDGVKGMHESLSVTLRLSAGVRDQIAAIGLRAIPTRLATARDYDVDANDSADQTPPEAYACPDWSDYHGFAVSTATDAELKPRDPKYDGAVDKDDNMMHLTTKLRTIPDEPYVVCAYTRDRVNNISGFSTPRVGQSYRATDTFAALPEELKMHMGHGCAEAGLAPLAWAAGVGALAAARMRVRRRARKTVR